MDHRHHHQPTTAWAPFKRAYRHAVGMLRAHVDERFPPALMRPHFDIRGEVDAIPWASFEVTVTDAWTRVAHVMLRRHLRQELEMRQASKAKKLSQSQLAEEMALNWLESRGLLIGRTQSKRARVAIEASVQEAIAKRWSIQRLAKEIREDIGLNEQDRARLAKFKDRQEDVPARTANARIERFRNRLLSDRAEAIAQSEVVSARENGKLQAWQLLQNSGDVAPVMGKQWVAGKCPTCRELELAGPVPLNDLFRAATGVVRAPPAHSRCGCKLDLVPLK